MNAEIWNNLRVCLWGDIGISRPPGSVGRYSNNMGNGMEDEVGDVPIYREKGLA